LQEFCDLLRIPAQNAYVFERGVSFDNGTGKHSAGRTDLYKRGCLVLETKQGADTPDQAAKAALGRAPQGSCRARYRQVGPDGGRGSFR
jgi:hypothetical protein